MTGMRCVTRLAFAAWLRDFISRHSRHPYGLSWEESRFIQSGVPNSCVCWERRLNLSILVSQDGICWFSREFKKLSIKQDGTEW